MVERRIREGSDHRAIVATSDGISNFRGHGIGFQNSPYFNAELQVDAISIFVKLLSAVGLTGTKCCPRLVSETVLESVALRLATGIAEFSD